MTDNKLEDLIDFELAKQAWCTLDIYHDHVYWRTEWSDLNGEIVRRESYNDANGYEIILPRLKIIIVSNDDNSPYSFGNQIFPVDRHVLMAMLFTGKDRADEEKELPN